MGLGGRRQGGRGEREVVVWLNPNPKPQPHTLAHTPRNAYREAAYRHLFKCLTHYALGPSGLAVLAAYLPTLTPIFLASLRASAGEQYAACRVLEASAVVLGGGNDEQHEAIEPALKRLVLGTGHQPQVRAAALRALAVSALVCSTDFSTTVVLLDLCEAAAGERYRGEER